MKTHRISPEAFCFALLVALAAFISLACAGCKSTGTAVRIEQRRVVGITSAELAEYTIPVISIGEGPSVSAYQAKDAGSRVRFNGTAVTTNRTSILFGMYDSDETKTLTFEGDLQVDGTNAVPGACVFIPAAPEKCRCVDSGDCDCRKSGKCSCKVECRCPMTELTGI